MHLNPAERKAFQHNLNRYIDESGIQASVTEDGRVRLGMAVWYE